MRPTHRLRKHIRGMQLLSSSTGSPQVALPQSSPTDNDVNCTNLHVSGNTKLGDTYDSATEVFGTLTVSDTLVAGYEVVSNSTLTSVRVSSLTVSSIDGGAPAIDAAGVPTILGALTADSGSFSDTVIANSLYSRGSITARDLSTFTISTDSASVTGTVNSGDVVTGVVNASSYVQSTLFYTDTLAAYNGDYLSFDPFVLTHQYIATPTIQTIDMGPQGGTMLNIKAYPSTLTIDVWNHGGANDLTSVVNFCARGSAQPISF